ncbi:hypothetical protein yc1106_06157 [Curvularia clavata]|uniref:Uncharacterized protein n=1 Tax=Curvularia clavata TaxID=95742 RepID=A0A9Q8ZDU1_CURCL|nr:hypothetical protein yc1106_06157 [Curvularia clavata]
MTSPTSSPSPKRDIFLVVYQDKIAVPAHWALFVPFSNDSSHGTKIHAIGAPFFGYGLEINPSYDLNGTKRRHIKILLGQVDEAKVPELEEVAKVVPTPGVSKTPLDPFAVGYSCCYMGVVCEEWNANECQGEHCQHWLRKYVDRLILNKVVEKDVVRVLGEAPTLYNGAA